MSVWVLSVGDSAEWTPVGNYTSQYNFTNLPLTLQDNGSYLRFYGPLPSDKTAFKRLFEVNKTRSQMCRKTISLCKHLSFFILGVGVKNE